MELKLTTNMIGAGLALLGYFSYSLADVALKFSGLSLSFYQVAFFTQGFGILAIVGYAIITKRSLKTYHPTLQLQRSIAYAICYACIIYAFQHKSLAETYAIFYISPFMTALFSVWIMKAPIGKHRIASIIIGFTGALIILRPGVVEIDYISLSIMLAATTFAYANVLTQKIGDKEPILSFTFYTTLFIFLVNAIPFAFNPVMPALPILGATALSGLLESFGTAVLAIAYLKAHAVTISKLMYVSIIWAFLFGYIFFNDVLVDGWTVIGGFIIISSGLYMIYRENLQTDKKGI